MEFKIIINRLSTTSITGTGNQTLEINEMAAVKEGLVTWIHENKPHIGDTLRVTIALEKM